jgi:uncharacterized protein involved in exopolysaccharide biosynthesis
MKQKNLVSLIDYLEVITKWRKFIVRNVVIVTVAAAIISLILTQRYTATTTLLPPNLEQEAMIGLLSANIPSGLAGLAQMGGALPGVTTPSDLFAAIMRSSRIKKVIIKKFDLKKEFGTKTTADAGMVLDDITDIEVTPEGIISIKVTYKNKYLATDIANSYVEELDKFNTETAMTTGKKFRIFIEKQLAECTDSLAAAEETLRKFQEKHRTVALDIEIQSAINAIAELKSRIMLLEVKKGTISSSAQANNPYLYSINKELNELRSQLAKIEFGGRKQNKNEFGAGFSVPFADLPEVSLEYARLFRDVKVQEAIFELLTQQYEQAKIMEAKDTPTVQFLDRASPPEKKSFPRRTVIVIIAMFCSFAFSILYAFVAESLQSGALGSEQTKKLSVIYQTLTKDFKGITRIFFKLFKK